MNLQRETALDRIAWRINRLCCMSLGEIIYRIQQSIRIYLQKFGIFKATAVPLSKVNVGDEVPVWIANLPELEPDSYITAAEFILSGRLNLFHLNSIQVGSPPEWNRDPVSGARLPMTFGPNYDYRSLEDGVDIRYVWELNRHLHLVTLAQAYALTRSRVYLQALYSHLDSWLVQCPYLQGPNWSSSLEAGIRLINWSITWQLIGGVRSQLFEEFSGKILRDTWLTSIYQHMHFIRYGFSRYSSANNHLIGEAVGLFVASRTWPYWDKGNAWGDFAQEIIGQQALLQNAPDGGNREQAFSYHQFVLSFLLIAGLVAKTSGRNFGLEYWQRIEVMTEFIASIMDVGGNVPMIGDADDGLVIRLSQEVDWCPFNSLLATGSVIFQRRAFSIKASKLDEQTLWLLGEKACQGFFKIGSYPIDLPIRRNYPDSGYHILGHHFETPSEIRILMDTGCLGYLSIAAHGHADALSITLSVGGNEILIDPGTYVYNTERKWRKYFRGTSAHNTLRLDGKDQAVTGGNFMWLKKMKVRCEQWVSNNEKDEVIASHNGYTRLKDPAIHRRIINFDKHLRQLFITDEIECKGWHEAEIFWHFSEQCDVHNSGDGIVALLNGFCITLQPLGRAGKLQLFQGDEDRPAGWVSRQFGVKVPASTVIQAVEVKGNSRFTTLIRVESAD